MNRSTKYYLLAFIPMLGVVAYAFWLTTPMANHHPIPQDLIHRILPCLGLFAAIFGIGIPAACCAAMGDHYRELEYKSDLLKIPLDLLYNHDPKTVRDLIFFWNRPGYTILPDGSVVPVISDEDTAHVSGVRRSTSSPPTPVAQTN